MEEAHEPRLLLYAFSIALACNIYASTNSSTAASNGDIEKQLLSNGYESDPTGMFHATKDPGEVTPSYIYQPADWFRPGRFFSIWAPMDVEIHDRKFILLDSKNTEGKGVRVEPLDRDGLVQLSNSSSAYRTTMGLKSFRSADGPSHPSGPGNSSQALSYTRGGQQQSKEKEDDLTKKLDKKFMNMYMDEHAHQEVPTGTFILLEHTYNIPFVKYKCVNHGMVDDESLDILRFHYVQYLISSWRLTSQAREVYGSR